jgi:hypothetical protein
VARFNDKNNKYIAVGSEKHVVIFEYIIGEAFNIFSELYKVTISSASITFSKIKLEKLENLEIVNFFCIFIFILY